MNASELELGAEELRQLREELEGEQAALTGQLQILAANSVPVQLDQQVQGRLSRMDALQQQAMSQAGERQARQHLGRVKRALIAMDQGEYGYCRQCGLGIGFARLQARPDSLLCVQCAEVAEQN